MNPLLSRLGFISWIACAYACVLVLSMEIVDDYMMLRGPGFFVAVSGAFTVVVLLIMWMRGEFR